MIAVIVITFTPAMLETGIVFGDVCLCVCPHKISKTTNNLVGICPMVNTRSDWKLVAFDLDLDFLP